MLIRHAEPLRGRRELICKGDEASVSKLRSGKKLLVERMQKVDRLEREMGFSFKSAKSHWFPLSPQQLSYHIVKFLSGMLAENLFPENFVRFRQMRIFEAGNGLAVATYSDFVPDENGVINRMENARKRFELAGNKIEREAIQNESRVTEELVNPGLSGLVADIGEAGLILGAPQANYHVSNGTTVFFEVDGLDLEKIAKYLTKHGNLETFIYFSFIIGLALKTGVGATSSVKAYARIKELREMVFDIGSELTVLGTVGGFNTSLNASFDYNHLLNSGPLLPLDLAIRVLKEGGSLRKFSSEMIMNMRLFLTYHVDQWIFDYFNQPALPEQQRASV